MAPAVSIVVPTYDRLAYLREAVDSVRAQTLSNWELIVVDDGSTDETVSWLASLADSRLRVVRREHTGRPSVLRNIGISLANAEWIAFLDSDDRWMPDKLERQLRYHTGSTRFRWSYTGHTIIDSAGEVRPPAQFKDRKAYCGWIYRELLELDAIIALPSVIAERALLREVGGFDESLGFVEDYELWLRLAGRFECGVIGEPLTVVRAHRSTSYDRAEVDEGFMSVYRGIASSTLSKDLRSIACRKEGDHAVWAANNWIARREWRRALSAALVAIRRQPFNRAPYRAAVRVLWHMVGQFTRRRADVPPDGQATAVR